jgi:cytochrome P450
MSNSQPPGPSDRFFGLTLLRGMANDYLGFFARAQQQYGDSVHMRIAGRHTYCFSHPDLIREILVEKPDAFIRYERHMEVLREVHGQSVLISEGDIWKKQRRILQPGFSPKRYEGYALQMGEAASSVLDKLAGHHGKPFDFEGAMNLLAMDVILRTMFGAKVEQETVDIEHAVRLLSEIAYEDMFYPVSLPDWLPLPRKRAKRRARHLLDDLIWSHIRARRTSREQRDDLLGMQLFGRAGTRPADDHVPGRP